jgi:hypothetical protein
MGKTLGPVMRQVWSKAWRLTSFTCARTQPAGSPAGPRTSLVRHDSMLDEIHDRLEGHRNGEEGTILPRASQALGAAFMAAP